MNTANTTPQTTGSTHVPESETSRMPGGSAVSSDSSTALTQGRSQSKPPARARAHAWRANSRAVASASGTASQLPIARVDGPEGGREDRHVSARPVALMAALTVAQKSAPATRLWGDA